MKAWKNLKHMMGYLWLARFLSLIIIIDDEVDAHVHVGLIQFVLMEGYIQECL